MKKYFFFSLLLLTGNVFAQKGLLEMLTAERNFASFSVLHGTKEAFVKFADTATIMFSQGEPVNGYQLWNNKKSSPGVLNWRPRYAEISSTGDFGYTCGPWTFHSQTTSDPVAAHGYFFTVWRKNEQGEWKFILDVGTDSGPLLSDTMVRTQTISTKKGSEISMWEAESDFTRMYKMDSVNAYDVFLSNQSITVREGKGLEEKAAKKATSGNENEGQITFSALGSGFAPGGDLGYVYGTAFLNGIQEAYLRIWRNEATGWKIALQLIRL